MESANTESIDFLTREIERLTRELDQTNSEKIQSAQYGIVLLEEKENLQLRCEELESLYENTRHELALTHEVCKYLYLCEISSLSIYFSFVITFLLNYRPLLVSRQVTGLLQRVE